MKVIIAGGRDFEGTVLHKKWLIDQLKNLNATTIICGMARGADMFGYNVAEELKLSILKFPAKWKVYGDAAGPIRNIEMAKVADACIIFPGGLGTLHMKKTAKDYKLELIEWKE